MKDEKIIIANWKMKLSLAETLALAKKIKAKFKTFNSGEIVICPNFISLVEVEHIFKGTKMVPFFYVLLVCIFSSIITKFFILKMYNYSEILVLHF